MTNPDKALLYRAFNARALNPIEVAQTFIPPAEFFRLANKSHTFIVGPRGSGKTTLLKMLQQPAIEAWRHSEAQRLRETIGFTGVFVPTDVTLATQLQAAFGQHPHGNALIRAAYAIHVLRAVLSAIEYRAGRVVGNSPTSFNRVELTHSQERELVSEISHSLNRKPRTPSFASFRTDLSSWLTEVFEFAGEQTLLTHESQAQAIRDSQLLRLDLTRTASIAIDAFEAVSGLHSERWAFLCDELELAPVVIVQDLLRRVRSTDDRFLFKLSLSPFVHGDLRMGDAGAFTRPVTGTVSGRNSIVPLAQENEDFDTIRLWYPNKKEGYSFGRDLAQSVISNKGVLEQTVDEILGRSVFDAPKPSKRGDASAYAPGSPRNKCMVRLKNDDETFAVYLRKKQIDLTTVVRDDDMRAKTLRKIFSIVILRDAFRKGRRKNPTVYSGASSFFAICESNPRFLIGILNQLIGGEDLSTPPLRVEAAKQAAVYAAAAARFRAYLRTIPCPSEFESKTRGLLSLIEVIGRYFRSQMIVGPFEDDPDGSFKVDAHTDDSLCESIERALNAGAIVWVPENSDESLLTSVRGKRFRLSYLLAPQYQLPLHLCRSINLGRILSERSRTQTPEKHADLNSQPSLFDNFDGEDE